ncbi:PLP-dependent lyase/thiolase [Candidatus Shapirobacteria bacterium]|nr:PLP-dependent lyase/thiolase [Candidatus Shapirobacteria bacterium]
MAQKISQEASLACQVGNTREVLVEGIILKREDENPTGSIKDRGISYQIDQAEERGLSDLVLSSSGNAAISAAYFCRRAGINLSIFVSPKISKVKLKRIRGLGITVFQTPRPISGAIRFAKENGFLNLRPSAAADGPVGYQSIAAEIFDRWGKIDSIFLPVSSGTTLVGVAEGFKKLGFLPQIHAVQTAAICPIAGKFDQDFVPVKSSLTSALVAKFLPRKKQVLELIRKSGGWGWAISDEEITQADVWLKERGISTSFEGTAALAGVFKARRKHWSLGEKIVCLLTGKKYD